MKYTPKDRTWSKVLCSFENFNFGTPCSPNFGIPCKKILFENLMIGHFLTPHTKSQIPSFTSSWDKGGLNFRTVDWTSPYEYLILSSYKYQHSPNNSNNETCVRCCLLLIDDLFYILFSIVLRFTTQDCKLKIQDSWFQVGIRHNNTSKSCDHSKGISAKNVCWF